MSLSLVLKPRVLRTYDSDAASYISAVESADNQALESGIKEAINEFVVGCKIRGIWNAIKSCCLLCGARTLNGAIVPLKGSAPILTDFIGDYNRETGLRRTSGTFDTNRNNNADPADNRHIAVYPTSIQFGTTSSNFINIISAGGNESWVISVASLGVLVRNRSVSNFVSWQPIAAGNLIGASVDNSSSGTILYNNIINTANITTSSPPTNVNIFLMLGSTSNRVSFYSIGERLDLRLLKQVVDRYMLDIINATVWDSEALNYITNVENADNDVLEDDIKKAINNFIKACKRDKIWGSIEASCFLCGARTLNGALIPLVGAAPTNVNFSVSDYDRKTGLLGNGSTKYLNSNRLNSDDGQNNHHFSCYIQSAGTTGVIMGAGGGDTGATTLSVSGASQNRSLFTDATTSSPTAFFGTSRNSSAFYYRRTNNTTISRTRTSETPLARNVLIFCTTNAGGGAQVFSDSRLKFYSIGTFLDLNSLNNKLDEYMTIIDSLS